MDPWNVLITDVLQRQCVVKLWRVVREFEPHLCLGSFGLGYTSHITVVLTPITSFVPSHATLNPLNFEGLGLHGSGQNLFVLVLK